MSLNMYYFDSEKKVIILNFIEKNIIIITYERVNRLLSHDHD